MGPRIVESNFSRHLNIGGRLFWTDMNTVIRKSITHKNTISSTMAIMVTWVERTCRLLQSLQ